MHRTPFCTAIVALVLLGISSSASTAAEAEPLPGTEALQSEGDISSAMIEGIDRFLLEELAASIDRRDEHWQRDTTSAETYNESVAANRQRLKQIIGAVDERVSFDGLELASTTRRDALVGRGEGFEAYAVRWPCIRGIQGEGLLLKPAGRDPVAFCIALPDADQTPEMLAGLTPGIEPDSQFARRLAESGCLVVVPMLIDRADTFSITKAPRSTNQPHREFVYRPAFEMGRHIIGYEVQKVLSLVDWFAQEASGKDPAVGVFGYGEGGLLALYAGACDTRIDVTAVSGYFDSRQAVWEEPIYRNVFALLHEFGDAELASLIAPRALLVEACRGPEVAGPPEPQPDRKGAAPGRLVSPSLESVSEEFQRAAPLVEGLVPPPRFELLISGDGTGPFGSQSAVSEFVDALAPGSGVAPLGGSPSLLLKDFDPQARLKRQIEQLIEDTQYLMREGEYVRRDLWSKADRSSLEKWEETTAPYREHFYNEVIGRFDCELLPPNARTRKVYDEPKYVGYEVVLDVFPDVMAYGILLMPKDLKEGEKRPVVVCQHGLEGRPQDVADPKVDSPYYHQFANRLAERGFITYAPQNPYIFQDRFRTLQRKLNPLKKTLFSVIVPQHQQTVDWLAGLPMVDPGRIAFYGLSYGGKSAMRIPALVPNYCLSICSGDFNEWIWKNVSMRVNFSYPATGEYEIFEFNLGNTYNYAEMAALIAPRPFMVERGHDDGVGLDEWVSYEYAKVRYLYTKLKIPDRTTIEYFDGPHEIHGVGTYQFLHEKLSWPE